MSEGGKCPTLIFWVCLKSLIFFFWGGGDMSDQVFGGTEQILGPSLCSRKKSEYHPPPSLGT